MEPTVYIFRMMRSDQGTLGMLFHDGFICYTLELPWREEICLVFHRDLMMLR